MSIRIHGNAMEELPHPPAPSPVQGEGGQETTLDTTSWIFRLVLGVCYEY
jgi:hypothetical protein